MASHEHLDAFNETTLVGREVIALRVSEMEQLCKSNGNSRFALMLTILVAPGKPTCMTYQHRGPR